MHVHCTYIIATYLSMICAHLRIMLYSIRFFTSTLSIVVRCLLLHVAYVYAGFFCIV